MKRQSTVMVLLVGLVLWTAPVAAQPILDVAGAALIELIDIGKATGMSGPPAERSC